ncbi:MAG: hypothetical protein KDH09_08605 [Chrysiogenetes bacterium]|nr:hypothetical protein [Chrysiogenetes bacterium]
MLPGYNHNIKYHEEIYHIQTEDSGVENPHIITLLYKGGNILARRKTSYADIVKNENLNEVVRELMQEQHKQMLRDLKGGLFDKAKGMEASQVPEAPAPTPAPPEAKTIDIDKGDDVESPFGGDLISDRSLDEVILSYLAQDEK